MDNTRTLPSRHPHHTPTAALVVSGLCALAIACLSFAAGYELAARQPVLCDAGDTDEWTDVSRPGEYPVYERTCRDGRTVLEID